MNPLTNVKNINKLNEIELSKGTVDKKSWHDLYKESAWIFIGGLAYGLTEGDILCVFSQYGEIVNINLVRDKKTGKIKGFCFLCYANQKSSILAVDNLNGIKLCGRTIRVDHVANYKPPKDNEQDDEITKMLKSEGCAPKPIKTESSTPSHEDTAVQMKKHKKHKKEKKKHKKRKREDPDEEFSLAKVKKEKTDEGYSKYEFPQKSKITSRKNESPESESSDCSSDSGSIRVSRKEKESHQLDKNHRNTDEKPSKSVTSWTSKHDKHHIVKSKHKLRKDRDSSCESDSHSSRKRKSLHASDYKNDLSSERRNLKRQKHKGGNSSNSLEEEYSEIYKMDSKNLNNKDNIIKNSNSRYLQHDSSSGSERDYHLNRNNRTVCEKREHKGRDYVERERNSYKDERQQDRHNSYQAHRNRVLPYQTDRHNERRNYTEKYEHFDKDREKKGEYGKHHSERKER